MSETTTAPAAPPPADIPSPAPAKPNTGAGADNVVANALRGTLLGGLLDPDEPLHKGSLLEPKKTDEGKEPDKTPAKGDEEKPVSADGTEDKVVADEVVKKPKPKTVKKAATQQQQAPAAPPVDVERIASAAATATVEAQARIRHDEQWQRHAATVPQEVVKLLPVYEELHRTNPSKYPQDLAARMANFVVAERSRAAKWETEHPGEAYNSEDEEHSQWYQSHQPDIDEDEFEDARLSILVDRKAREIVAKEVNPATAEITAKLDRQNLEPELIGKARTLGAPILKAVVPAFDGVLTKEAVDKISAEDPVAFDVAQRVDQAFTAVVMESGLLWRGLKRFDEAEPSHVAARRILTEFEGKLAELDPSELNKGGKSWSPLVAFSKMTPTEKARHYTVEHDDVINYIREHVAPSEAKRIYDAESEKGKTFVEKLAGKYGYKKVEQPTSTQQDEPETVSKPAPVGSPTVRSGAPAAAPGSRVQTSDSDFETQFFKRLGVG